MESGYNPKMMREIRKRLGANQRDFANMVRVEQSTVSRWEVGDMVPGADKMAIIYDICVQNDIARIPMFHRQGLEISLVVTESYKGEKTVA